MIPTIAGLRERHPDLALPLRESEPWETVALVASGQRDLGIVHRWGGVALLVFIIWHLIHFTIAKPNLNSEASAEAVKESPYVMISASFDLWWVVLIYLVAQVALGMHLYHGVWSAAQTMGLTGSATARSRAKALGALIAAVVVVGFLLPPYALFLDLV